jgi:hypothetical protein
MGQVYSTERAVFNPTLEGALKLMWVVGEKDKTPNNNVTIVRSFRRDGKSKNTIFSGSPLSETELDEGHFARWSFGVGMIASYTISARALEEIARAL